MKHVKRATRVSENGYISDIDIYQAQNCSGCPLRSLCHKSKENRKIEVCHELNRHKEIVRNLLNSEKGRMHRSKRPIEPEAVFGQMKFNKQYNRFRHFGKSKVMMDFAIFAIAFNLQKLLRKLAKIGSKCRFSLNIYFIPILCYYWRDTKSEIKIQFGTSEIIYPKIA